MVSACLLLTVQMGRRHAQTGTRGDRGVIRRIRSGPSGGLEAMDLIPETGAGEATVPPTSGSRGEGVTVDPVVRTAGVVATAATERTRPSGRRSTTREVTGAAAATALTAAVTEEMEAMPTATASIP